MFCCSSTDLFLRPLIVRPAKDFFLLCADTENCGIQEGVLTFSHDCMCGIFNAHSDPLSERTWF